MAGQAKIGMAHRVLSAPLSNALNVSTRQSPRDGQASSVSAPCDNNGISVVNIKRRGVNQVNRRMASSRALNGIVAWREGTTSRNDVKFSVGHFHTSNIGPWVRHLWCVARASSSLTAASRALFGVSSIASMTRFNRNMTRGVSQAAVTDDIKLM